MNVDQKPFADRKRMTRLGEATSRRLKADGRPILDDRSLFSLVEELYKGGGIAYLRGEVPTIASFGRLKDLLRSEKIITRDDDYGRLWRIALVPDLSAEEIVSLADPLTYISHLSAMQRYGLTNRRPTALNVTQASPNYWRNWAKDASADLSKLPNPFKLLRHTHPATVRTRALTILTTDDFGESTPVRGSFSRIATVGQTFLNMLQNPDLCGGMPHVVDVFTKHGATYVSEIIPLVEAGSAAIIKVRAGYLLEERLGIHDPRIASWRRWAQRGGSRKLDPQKPYVPRFSEDWMISLNA